MSKVSSETEKTFQTRDTDLKNSIGHAAGNCNLGDIAIDDLMAFALSKYTCLFFSSICSGAAIKHLLNLSRKTQRSSRECFYCAICRLLLKVTYMTILIQSEKR